MSLSTNQGAAAARPQLSRRSSLPPEALRDLDAFFDLQRSYYGIPAGHPVYPPLPRAAGPRTGRAAPVGKNGSDHPWRQQ